MPFAVGVSGRETGSGRETAEECIIRELEEELELQIAVSGVYARVLYHLNGREIPITFFNAEITGGKMKLCVHEDARWIKKSEIPDYTFMPPDIEVAERLSGERDESIQNQR